MERNYKFTFRKKIYFLFKRFFDILGSIIGILLTFPLAIVVSFIIKCTSKGPIFFKQLRIGKNQKKFYLIKFRSMYIDSPEIPPSELSIEDQKKMQYSFGTFIRKTSIDEIPQLFNILKGDMSFIGPRPGAAKNEDELIKARLMYTPNAFDVRAGLTGYAQVMMNREHNPLKKAELDHYYVENINFLLDAKIFLRTIIYIFTKEKGR